MEQAVLPRGSAARATGRAAWGLARSGWETIVWGNVKAGSVALRGTPLSFRVLIRVALWLTVLLLAGLLAADLWRRLSPLLPLVFNSDSLTGLFAPRLLVPVIIGLFVLAWAYLVTGALHAPWWVKLPVLLLFLAFDLGLAVNLVAGVFSELSLLLGGLSVGLWSTLATAVHLAGWLALAALILLRWRRPNRLGFEFPAALAVVATLLYSSYFGNQLGNRTFESENVSTALQLTQALQLLNIFLMPFLLMAGAEAAEFGMTVTEKVTARLQQTPALRRPWGRRLLIAALVFFLLVRVISQWLIPLLREGAWAWRHGAAVIVLAFGVVWLLRRKAAPLGALPPWVVPAAAMGLYGSLFVIQLLSFVEIGVAVAVVLLGRGGSAIMRTIESGYDFLARWNEVGVGAVALLGAVLLVAAARRRRQPPPGAALYAALFGVWIIFWVSTRQGEWLGALNFQFADLAALMTPVVLGLLLVLALARRLTWRSLLHLTAAALLFWILEFQGWLSDPLSPLSTVFGAESVFLTVSIFLNVMAAGNRFSLNAEAPRFPRTSRGLLYFGYALLTVTNLNWLAAAHSVSAMTANDQIAQNGFIAIGLPLAFWALLTANPELLGEPAPAN